MKKPRFNKLKKCTVGLMLIIPVGLMAQQQDIQLANQYYDQKEYDKAKSIYQKLIKKDENEKIVYKNYIKTLQRLKETNEAEKYIKKLIKNKPDNIAYKAEYIILLEDQNKIEEANKNGMKFINEIAADSVRIERMATYFMENEKLDWSEKAYQEARNRTGKENAYAIQLANIYRLKNETVKMVEEYINIAADNKSNLSGLQNILQDNLTKQEDLEKFEQILITKIQKDPGQSVYSDLLIWYYIQQKEFTKAFFQARSLDKRLKQEGSKVMEIGLISLQNKDYKSASTIFEYLVKEYPKSSSYPTARRYLIVSKEELVKQTYPINKDQIISLIADYQKLISEIGKTPQTAEALRSIGLLHAFYLDQKEEGLNYLNEAVKIARADNDLIAKSKLDMGDIYLLKNEPWEATLLYSQVEKSNKEQPIGYEAKLRNAKLSYYKGDFELAQGHLDILKMATSREIANDAMDLSLLIQDNIALDTLGEAMKEYANVELMLFQNKNEEAMRALEGILQKYPNHSLTDELFWLKAQILIKENQNQKAIEQLEKIVSNYPLDILGDDAHFLMAKLYEEKLGEKEKAMELYQNHLTKYPGSIYVADSRKRFRQLRGDSIN
jgi:tetratricopeptide (TPR) repeat protein